MRGFICSILIAGAITGTGIAQAQQAPTPPTTSVPMPVPPAPPGPAAKPAQAPQQAALPLAAIPQGCEAVNAQPADGGYKTVTVSVPLPAAALSVDDAISYELPGAAEYHRNDAGRDTPRILRVVKCRNGAITFVTTKVTKVTDTAFEIEVQLPSTANNVPIAVCSRRAKKCHRSTFVGKFDEPLTLAFWRDLQ